MFAAAARDAAEAVLLPPREVLRGAFAGAFNEAVFAAALFVLALFALVAFAGALFAAALFLAAVLLAAVFAGIAPFAAGCAARSGPIPATSAAVMERM